MRRAPIGILLTALSTSCGPSIQPCAPQQCLTLADHELEGSWSLRWDTARIYLQRACDAGIAAACREWGTYGVTISNERPEEEAPATAALERGCKLGDGESCYHAGFRRPDAVTFQDRACELGYRDGCEEAAMLRAESASPDERKRAVPVLEEGCRAKRTWLCTRLIAVFEEPPLKDAARARQAHVLHCEAGDRNTCTRLGFEAGVGLGTAKDPEEAKRLVRLGCDSPTDCKATAQLERWLAPGEEPRALVRVLEANPDHFVAELPPGVALPVGTEVAELGASLQINGVAGFQGTVIEEQKGRSVMRQKAMSLGSPAGSFSASLTITPALGSLVLLSWKATSPPIK